MIPVDSWFTACACRPGMLTARGYSPCPIFRIFECLGRRRQLSLFGLVHPTTLGSQSNALCGGCVVCEPAIDETNNEYFSARVNGATR